MKKIFVINGQEVPVENMVIRAGQVSFTLDGVDYAFSGAPDAHGEFTINSQHSNYNGFVGKRTQQGMQTIFMHGGIEAHIDQHGLTRNKSQAGSKGAAHTAPMPGTIQKILVTPGQVVEAGEPLVIMEAMKLQLNIEAAYAGTVEEVLCETGGLVSDGTLLVDVKSNDAQ
ncbi:MAG: biotin/lipoyl-binding protein [Alphaproteobacteria bacterium]|nr:biotin/lipoyl-binding protein [Alphaproteobacteria bacterium]